MADGDPVHPRKSNENPEESTLDQAGNEITVHVKTHQEKETFVVPADISIKDVCTVIVFIT